MTQLRELVSGDGSLDTALRGLALTIFMLVAAALIWTTVSVRAAAYPDYEPYGGAFFSAPDTVQVDSQINFNGRKVAAFRKEHRQ